MRALDRKLLRDLWRLRGQVLAVAIVVASGVALLVMSLSALTSLRDAAAAYYDRTRFADVFAEVVRAPESLVPALAAIPGVQTVETRVAAFARADLAPGAPPVMLRAVSLPEQGEALLNRTLLTAGRMPDPLDDDEALLHEPFAKAHGLGPGDILRVVLHGRERSLRITGLALSPEFVFAIAPGGLMPDDARFGILWMGRRGLAAALDLEGAFSSVSLALLRGTDPAAVIEQLDPLLAPWGGTGAIPRAEQISNWFLTNEFDQLRTMATVLPAIFLTVAAFLTNTVLARLVATERQDIALLKAFGYSTAAIGLHYAKLAAAMTLAGFVLGAVIGTFLGRWNTALYAETFRLPLLAWSPGGSEFLIGAAVSLAAALLGALTAVRRAAAMPPAEAMRPPAPLSFRAGALGEGLVRRLDSATRIIVRAVLRAPLRGAMTMAGVALAIGVLVLAFQWRHSVETLATSYFSDEQRQDAVIGFTELRAGPTRHEVARLPGVRAVEPRRIVPAELRAGPRRHRGALTGLPAGGVLHALPEAGGATLPVPAGGVVLTSLLAEKLGVAAGDRIEAEILEGARARVLLTVAGTIESHIGMSATMDLDALNRALGDGAVFEYAAVLLDPARAAEFHESLKALPAVATVMVKAEALAKFHETIGETILVFIGFFTAFAGALAFGTTYNATRVALSERGHELATLRVLGFTRGEVAYVLLGETALLVLLAVPLGCLAGAGLVFVMNTAFSTELFRVPFVLYPSAFASAILVVLGSALLSALLVRRRLDDLDLIAVLKTRE